MYPKQNFIASRWGITLVVLLAFFSCKRVQETADAPVTKSPTSVPKKALREKPDIQIPEPVPVGHARVELVIETILPLENTANSTDPCSKVPCRAMARVQKVIGFGSSFTAAVADGQLIEVYFPMTMSSPAGSSALGKDEKVVADLQNPLVGSSTFIVSEFARQM